MNVILCCRCPVCHRRLPASRSWSNLTAACCRQDGGVLALREVEQHGFGSPIGEKLAACMIDPRAADQITHSLADVIRFRLLMISAGYEDGNDANALRRDPMFKMALDLSPIDRELCSQSTISRLENLPDVRADAADGQGDGRSVCASRASPRFPNGSRWTSTTRSMRSTVGQQLRLFNAHCKTNTRISADRRVRRRGPLRHRRASSRQAAERQGDQALPGRFLLCARSALTGLQHRRSCCGPTATIAVPRFSDWCRANGLDYILGIAPTATLRMPPCRRVSRRESQHEGEISRPRRETASFVVSLWRSSTARKAGAGSSGSSPACRSGRGRTGHPLRRHQSEQSLATLAGSTRMSIAGAARPKTISSPGRPIWRRIARPAPGRHANQFRLFLACGRLLADVGPTRVDDAKAFDVARRPVRHVAPPPHQDCRPRRREMGRP